MMQTRHKVFETNSSSSHSLSISSTGNFETFNQDEIVVETGEFGWEQESYSYFDGKASYVLTSLLVTKIREINSNEDLDDERCLINEVIESEPHLKMLHDVIKEYTGADKVKFRVSNFYYVDHQSSDLVSDEGVITSEENLKNFLFNTHSYVETDNDNH